MENGAETFGRAYDGDGAESTQPRLRDARDSILLAERAIAETLDAGDLEPSLGANAFGGSINVLPELHGEARVQRARERMEKGERVGFVAEVADLVPLALALRGVAGARLGAVFHVVVSPGAPSPFWLGDLGWSMLFASGPAESVDLSLVARRAAEDSGTPFFVIHDHPVVRAAEPVALDKDLVTQFLGPSSLRGRAFSGQAGSRALAERAHFALASALRDLESLTRRKRDMLTRSGAGEGADASLLVLAVGQDADVLLRDVPRLRALGHDVGAVKLTAWRPFPGPRLVRVLARALAITVVERAETPLAQSSPLTCEVKAAFADALTWAPEYPGVGRIPRIHSATLRPVVHDLEPRDIDAAVANMLAGDHGKRHFELGEQTGDSESTHVG
jgi:pyruvate-ferredoxin/flavodoxin oxidoreductase